MKIRVNTTKHLNQANCFFILILITPIIDTINGAYVRGYGETGFSVGTIYRMFILLYAVCFNKISRKNWIWIIVMSYFPISSILRCYMYNLSFLAAFSYGLKWLFPIVIISAFYRYNININISKKIIEIWRFLIPLILIFEFLFKMGDPAYPDAGWRGLFYCNNDIAFSLTMMLIFSLYDLIVVKVSTSSVLSTLLNLIAILILSTKSCLIFAFLSILTFIVIKFKAEAKKACGIIVIALVGCIGVAILFRENIEGIVTRYGEYYSNSMHNFSFANIMNFLTSSRTTRLQYKFNDVLIDANCFKLLFGWVGPENNLAIEMDWFDLLFQHGVLGLVLAFSYYFVLLKKEYSDFLWKYIICIAMICSFFSGHVINGALPSTVFAVVVSCALQYDKKKNVNEDII